MTAAPACWDVMDGGTRDLVVKMNVHRLLGDVASLPPMEAAERVSTVIADSLCVALHSAGLKGDAASSVRRHFNRLLQRSLR